MTEIQPPFSRPDFAAFTAKLEQRRERAARRKLIWRRGLVAFAAVAVPAFAAPQAWSDLEIGDAGEAVASVEPMPFEKPGESFPGSAF